MKRSRERARSVGPPQAIVLLAVAAVLAAACSSVPRANTTPTPSAPATSSGASPSGPSPSPPPAPGVTATTITVGFVVASGDANAELGAKDITTGDEGHQALLIVREINANGGIDGRKLVPIFHGFDPTSKEPASQQDQEACTDFTQDRPVFAAFPGNASDEFKQCMQDAGAITIAENLEVDGQATFDKFPTYIEPAGINLDRIAAAEIPALKSQGYFGSNPTIGIVTLDDPAFAEATDNVLVPAIQDAGFQVSPADIARVHRAQTNAEVAETSAAISAAVLKFKANGVDHVIFLEAGGLVPFFFLPAAEKQKYRPTYAFTTNDGPQALLTGGNIPKAQVIGAKGVGWQPAIDYTFGTGPSQTNQQAQRCISLMKAGGEKATDGNAYTVELLTCDQVWFLQAALQSAGTDLNRDTFLQGVAALGTSYDSALALGTNFSDTQHDGVSKVADYGWVDSCSCFQYTSAPKDIS